MNAKEWNELEKIIDKINSNGYVVLNINGETQHVPLEEIGNIKLSLTGTKETKIIPIVDGKLVLEKYDFQPIDKLLPLELKK